MTETGITITFDNFDADTGPLAASPSSTQLDSDNWAVDLDNDNNFDMDGGGGFGDAYANGEKFTANEEGDEWDDYDSEDIIHSYDFDLDGLNASAPSIGMAVTANFGTNVDALITKIQNTGTLEITDLELELDAYYYYEIASSSIAYGTIGIYYYVSSTNITNDLSSASWTELTTLNNNNEYSNGWKKFEDETFEINGVSLDVNEYLYVKFTFDPNSPPQYGNDQALALDNIFIKPVGFGGTDATTTLVIDESGSSTAVDPTSSSVEIFQFDIVDDGASDGYATTFSQLVIADGTSNAINDWTDLFETVTLTDETGGGSSTATIDASTLTFSGLNYATATDMGYVGDGSTKTYSLTIDFVDTYSGTQGIDNELLQFLVQASTFEIEGVSSTFQTANQIETSSSNNILDVTASVLELQDEPTVVGTGTTSDVYFGFSLRTVDAAGHLDEDVTSSFTITEATEVLESGSLTFTSGAATANFTAGVYTFSDLFFDTSGNYTLLFTSGAGYTGTNFAVTAATSWRTAADGDWGNSSGTVWEYFVDGSGWVTAGTNENPNATSANVGPIYIYNTVAIETTGYNADQLFIESGGILDVNNAFTINDDGTSEYDLNIADGGTLDVEAAVTITGTFLVESGNSTAGGGIITSSNADYVINFGVSTNGYWETYSLLRYTTNASIVLTGNETFFPNANSNQYPILEITAIRYKSLSTGGFTMTVNGILYYTDTERIELITNDYVIRNGLISESGSDLRYDNLTSMPGDTLFFSGNIYSQGAELDLTISSSAPSVIELLGDVTSSGNDKINFEMQSGGTLILGDYDCDFGDYTFQSGSTIKVSNSLGFGANQFADADALVINNGTIFHFNGSVAQTTGFGTLNGGTTSVAKIVVDNSAGLTLDSDITITSLLTFEDGIFNAQPTAPGVMTVSSSASFSGFSSSSHIQGPVTFEAFASSKFIPIGDHDAGTDYYRPVIVDPDASMTVTTAYIRSDPSAISTTFDIDGSYNPQAITTSGYYDITLGATGTVDIGLYFDPTDDAIASSDNLVVAKYDNSAGEWVGYESISYGADYILASVTIDDLADTYFTVASVTSSLLPVELVSFSGKYDKNDIVLGWTTASELNNDRFEIEHSENGIDFHKIGQVTGVGTSNKKQSYSYRHSYPNVPINYYMLKQVDYDGIFEYSSIITVSLNSFGNALHLLGNPIKNQRLKFSYQDLSEVDVRIVNLSGRKFLNKSITSTSDTFEMHVNQLPPGMYFLFVNEAVERFVIY
ncbi:Por secretion system C-terminal sorting domain-containing protein [Reichenbachiella faecimaris]|uniref:Por secretion system C-terminal sorting domain-containing protein n=2 Tax=Reichenbachiella faecimaris TaxID=692418 RepID=A0A1W2G533_REIFA|nr:Por secretion system C-terminal sorting domain-containing protein [Reichenbachiella faecimaris]